MSTIIMIILAGVIIFWHPPFQLPRLSRRIIAPILIIVIVGSLFLLVSLSSTAKKECPAETVSETDSPPAYPNQSTFSN